MSNSQKKNQNYDARLNWDISNVCNLNCVYCIWNNLEDKQNVKRTKINSDINIPALIKTLNKTKKTFRINFRGRGEPFLIPNIVEACIEITKYHFISFITNLTPKKIKNFSEKVNPEKVLLIFASCHIKELERLNLMDRFIKNFHLCKKKGFNIIASEVAHPQLLNEIEKYKEFFQKNGIQLNFQNFFGEYNGKMYPESYTEKEIKIFDLDTKMIKIHNQKGNLCNAGYNIGIVNSNGDIRYCDHITKSIGNIYDKIKFNDKIIRCPYEICVCPINMYDPYLFKKGIQKINLNIVNPNFLRILGFLTPLGEKMRRGLINYYNTYTQKLYKFLFRTFERNIINRFHYLLKILSVPNRYQKD